jgi:hypothetical protein
LRVAENVPLSGDLMNNRPELLWEPRQEVLAPMLSLQERWVNALLLSATALNFA